MQVKTSNVSHYEDEKDAEHNWSVFTVRYDRPLTEAEKDTVDKVFKATAEVLFAMVTK